MNTFIYFLLDHLFVFHFKISFFLFKNISFAFLLLFFLFSTFEIFFQLLLKMRVSGSFFFFIMVIYIQNIKINFRFNLKILFCLCLFNHIRTIPIALFCSIFNNSYSSTFLYPPYFIHSTRTKRKWFCTTCL